MLSLLYGLGVLNDQDQTEEEEERALGTPLQLDNSILPSGREPTVSPTWRVATLEIPEQWCQDAC